jgi:hypothetical protein
MSNRRQIARVPKEGSALESYVAALSSEICSFTVRAHGDIKQCNFAFMTYWN